MKENKVFRCPEKQELLFAYTGLSYIGMTSMNYEQTPRLT